MKNQNFIYLLGTTLVIAGAVMKILHLPYGNEIFLFGLISMTLFQSWHVTQLKKKIKDLESRTSHTS